MATIVFKDLHKLVSHSQQEKTHKQLFERLQGKPFWIWDKQQHKLEDIRTDVDCCFNHIIGLPTKEGVEKAMFDYEKILYDSIFLVNDVLDHNYNHNYTFKHKHLWVKKATGLGVTEFFLRLMAWLCLRNNDYQIARCVL
jgi:hypothetical protein